MMMNNFNNIDVFSIWSAVHWLFGLAFLMGLVLFVVWAIHNVKKDDFRKWITWLLVVGILGWLITAPIGGFGFGRQGKLGSNTINSMMGGFSGNQMAECMQNEECHKNMEDFMHRMMGIEDHE